MYKAHVRNGFHISTSFRRDDEQVVQNGLAITPSEVESMVKRGIPVSTQSNALLKAQDYGDKDWDVPLGFRRGEDPLADGYQKAKDVHERLHKAIDEHRVQQQQQQTSIEEVTE